MQQKFKYVWRGDEPRILKLKDRGMNLGSSGRRFWFNIRAMLSITRTSIASFARSIGMKPSTVSMLMYLSDARGKDSVSSMTALGASEIFGIPADFFLHADPGRLCNIAQLKRFEYRGTKGTPTVDPYRLAYMDMLAFDDGLEVVKLAYEAAGVERTVIEETIARVLETIDLSDVTGIPSMGTAIAVKEA